MSRTRPKLLLTRPLAQSRAFAESLPDAFDVIISPLVRLVLRPVAQLEADSALILTSSNAVTALAASVPPIEGRSAYCVGKATAEAARNLGAQIILTAPTARDLLDALRAHPPGQSLCYLRAEHISLDLEKHLKEAGIDTNSQVVYALEDEPFTEPALDWLCGAEPVIVPLFSTRSAARLARALPDPCAPLHLVAISQKVGDAWTGPRPASLRVAAQPDARHMRDEINPLAG